MADTKIEVNFQTEHGRQILGETGTATRALSYFVDIPITVLASRQAARMRIYVLFFLASMRFVITRHNIFEVKFSFLDVPSPNLPTCQEEWIHTDIL